MNQITTQPQPSEAILLAEIEQLRTRLEVCETALDNIAHASDVPPPGYTWQSRCNHWRNIARAALVAAEGG